MSNDQAADRPAPDKGFSMLAILPSLLLDMILPVVLFNLLTNAGLTTIHALVASGVPPAIHALYDWFKSGRVEPLGIVILLFLAVGAATSLLTGSVFIALIKDSFLTATFGLICLGSLLAERPLLFTITRQFTAGSDPTRRRVWDARWSIPAFRHAQRLVTIVWGVAYLIEAAVRVVAALRLTPQQVVTFSPVLSFGVTIALILWTKRYLHAVHDRHVRGVEVAPDGLPRTS